MVRCDSQSLCLYFSPGLQAGTLKEVLYLKIYTLKVLLPDYSLKKLRSAHCSAECYEGLWLGLDVGHPHLSTHVTSPTSFPAFHVLASLKGDCYVPHMVLLIIQIFSRCSEPYLNGLCINPLYCLQKQVPPNFIVLIYFHNYYRLKNKQTKKNC